MASAAQTTPDTLVTIKAIIDGATRRFKLPLRDVGINVLESKLRTTLNIPDDADALFERYSDSAAAYVVLDQANTAVYKQLYRAAKAKHKLKLRITVQGNQPEDEQGPKPASVADAPEEESHPSVEPTDTEREPEQSIATNLAPAPAAAPAPVPAKDQPSAKKPTSENWAVGVHATTPFIMDDTLAAKAAKAAKEASAPELPSPPAPCAVGCPAIRANYAVCCNNCDQTIPDAHYHCSTCDDGDFDLCQECVDRGVTCKGSSHWLIKRFVKNGVIINSTTERLPPKPKAKPEPQPQSRPEVQPQPRQQPKQTWNPPERVIPVFNDFLYSSIRTCNCCVSELPETEFVHCTTCDDYDLCKACFAKNRHGHHPKHAFAPAVEGTKLDPEVASRLAAGRGQRHHAICDGCDKTIRGVRHKCLECPDWDYCAGCVVNSGFIHPGHRFVPIYEPLTPSYEIGIHSVQRTVHSGICCDGPLCASARVNGSSIVGDRYKCAVCHDTDFCSACEASPANTHNRTHPLIKFKTPVRHVSVTTTGDDLNGRQMPVMGDIRLPISTVSSSPPAEANSPPSPVSGVQTVIEAKPSEPAKVEEKQPVQIKEGKTEQKTEKKPVAVARPYNIYDLGASFVRDTVQDGTVFGPDHVFEQTWILRNNGKIAWPAGCSVKYVGGEYMGSLDSSHPAATRDVQYSCESTISYAPVQPGDEFPFTVLLRTPNRSGRVVSNWRLTTSDGQKFGHRLWCDVVVVKPVAPPPQKPAEPAVEETKEAVEPEQEPETKRELKQSEIMAPESEQEQVPKPEMEQSQMIFPKLEKESPVASVHEEVAKTESPLSALEDEYEDCEDPDWNEAESEEGFMTDEEYDILDASDEEFNSLDGRSKQK